MYIIYFGLIIKIILVLIQSFYVFPGTSFDTQSFHLAAVEFSEYIKSGNPLSDYNYRRGWVYSVFVGFFYSIFGELKILGGLLSALTWFLSAVISRKILLLFKLDDYRINLFLLCYVIILPISFYYTSLMLREVYMLLFVNLLFLSIVSLALNKKFLIKIFYFLIFLLSLILLLIFHKANLYFSIIFLPLILIFIVLEYLKKINFNIVDLSKMYWLVLLIIIAVLIHKLGILEQAFNIIVDYQLGHFYKNTVFRADYFFIHERVDLDYTLLTFIGVIYNNIFNYLLQPTPINITTFQDQILFYENLIRFLILIYLILNLFRNFQMKSFYIIGFMILATMEIVYASGTVNWGTASRHHVPTQGILLLLLFFPKKKLMT